MTQLDRFLTGHFAPHYSPTRERRELRFAATPPAGNASNSGNPLEQTPEGNAEKLREGTEGRAGETIAGIIKEINEQVEGEQPIDTGELYASLDVADELVSLDRISDHDLEGIARKLNINIDVPYEKKLSVYERIMKNIHAEQKAPFIEELKPLVEQCLRESADSTLKSAWTIQERVRQISEVEASVQRILFNDEKIKSLQNEIIKMQDDNLQDIDANGASVDNPMLRTLETELDNHIHRKIEQLPQTETGTQKPKTISQDPSLEDIVRWHFDNIDLERRKSRQALLTDAEKRNLRASFINDLVLNAKKKVRRSRNIGGNQTPKESTLFENSASYLARLKKQERDLKKILDAQLKQRSLDVMQLHLDHADALLQQLSPPRSLEYAVRTIRSRTPVNDPNFTPDVAERENRLAEALEKEFLKTHGISIVALLVSLDQLAESELPRDLRDPSFLVHAKEDLEKRDVREAELRSKDGASLALRELQKDQLETEKWAFTLANEIKKFESQMNAKGLWRERLDMARSLIGLPESQRDEFVTKFMDELNALLQYADANTEGKRAALRTQLDKCVTPMTYTPDAKSRIEKCVAMLIHSPGGFRKTVKEAKDREARAAAETRETPASTAIERVCQSTRKRLDQIIGDLVPVRKNTDPDDAVTRHDLFAPLRHEVSTYLNIQGAFLGKKRQLEQQLDAAFEGREKDGPRALNAAYFAEAEVDKLHMCKELLEEIELKKEFKLMSDRVFAMYDRAQCKIVINSKLKTDPRMDEAYQHERGHAILHILTERTGLFPNLIEATYEAHKDLTTDRGETFEEALFSLKDFGSYRHLEDQNLQGAGRREAFTEELLVRYADWSGGRSRAFDPRELQLFNLLENGFKPIGKADPRAVAQLESIGSYGKHRESQSHLEDDAPVPAEQEIFNMKEILSESARALNNVKQFLVAYEREPARFPPSTHSMLKGMYDEAEVERVRLFAKFIDQSQWAGGIPPEETPKDQQASRNLQVYAGKLEDFVKAQDVDNLDTTKEPRQVGLWDRMWRGVRLGSILDIVKLWNDTVEDFQQIYKRRQDGLLRDVGYAISKPLQDSSLLKKLPLPWLNEYLPGLHAYHQRRYSGTEVEAANKWKDGMKNEDSATLLQFIHHTNNKDAVRGIMNLLAERGDMDWNDTGVWRTLSALSGYDMPEGPCLRNDVLRDTWLRKIISYIWNDKELYYELRSQNDSKTKSGKESFTPWVDQLSNVGGGMRAELQKQLRLFTEWTQTQDGSPPEDVKPHLFEKVIHYAIENGKMTMEDKFYYLIRGVASGILSIDRLRTLAGEEGGVLNQFPFIDYFYGKNNTLPELKALAKRLTETDAAGNDTFKPGSKTTMWIQLELVRDEGVQKRLSKGTSRTSSETIDHEDVPLFLPQLDYNAVRGMADVISGSRQKMSPEALKNLYCGYSSKFKIFGRLAQLEDEKGIERFTSEDARILADAIGAYVDVDNLLTRKAWDRDSRPSLSTSQLNSLPVSGDGQHTTMQYRMNMNKFVLALIREIGPEIEQTMEWQTFQNSYKKKDAKIKEIVQPDGTTRKVQEQEKKFDLLGDYITTDMDAIEGRRPPPRNNADTAKKLFEGTPAFVEALKKILPRRRDVLKRALKAFTIDYKLPSGASNPNYENGFFDESGSAGAMTLDNAEAAVRAREAARSFRQHLPGAR